MLLARVEGSMIATRKHPSLQGWRMLICQPLNAHGLAEGTPVIAIDPLGAGTVSYTHLTLPTIYSV